MMSEDKWVMRSLLVVSVIAVYVGIAMLLYSGWLKGDDFLFARDAVFDREGVYGAIHWYINHVSRMGEVVGHLLGLAASRWQHWVITPIFLVIMPFIIVRLVNPGQGVSCRRVLIFFWFACFLMLQSVGMWHGHWRNFWCYAAAVNYFWSSVISSGFLALMVAQKWGDPVAGHSRYLVWSGLFCLGCCCGWGTESVTVVLLPLLVLVMVVCVIRRISVPTGCWFGLMGMAIGAFFLFASPALQRRGMVEAATRKLDVNALSPEQITDFVQNLDPGRLQMLVGSSGVVSLAGIPMLQHVYFLPFLADRYWQVCMLPSLVLIILVVVTLWLRPDGWRRSILISLGIYAFSWLSAVSYLGACMPSLMSFLPQSFMVVVACALLFLRLRGKYATFLLSGITFVVVLMGGWGLAPAGMEAWEYKKYEHERFAAIAAQKAAGCEVIEIPYPSWQKPPVDFLGLIRGMDFGYETSDYPNGPARNYFKVKGIRKEKKRISD